MMSGFAAEAVAEPAGQRRHQHVDDKQRRGQRAICWRGVKFPLISETSPGKM